MIPVSQEFKDSLNVSHKEIVEFTVTVPGGDPVEFECSAAGVSSSADIGTRYQGRLSVVPQPGVDLYSILSTPGAQYRIRWGIDFGANNTELIDLGVYEASAGSINIIDGDISVTLVDMWVWLDRVKFASPLTVNGTDFASRAELLSALVNAAWPSLVYPGGIVVLDDGGVLADGDRVWDVDRTQVIKDVATDGQLDVYFNNSGQWVIRKQPVLDPLLSVWTFRTGGASNIFTADRERPFDRLYNTVVVNPIDEEQTWTQQAATIEDTAHPNYFEKIGIAIYSYSSPTITSDFEALEAASTILQRVQGTTETVNLGSLGAPMLEVGDCVTIAHEATFSDPGFNAVHIIDSWDYDLLTGAMTLKTRSSDLAEVGEG